MVLKRPKSPPYTLRHHNIYGASCQLTTAARGPPSPHPTPPPDRLKVFIVFIVFIVSVALVVVAVLVVRVVLVARFQIGSLVCFRHTARL
jgi:hypothetical protein